MKRLLLPFCLVSLWVASASAASYTLNLPSGLSLIANHLNHAGGNTLDNILPSPPDGTVFYKWSCSGWTAYTYDAISAAWFPNGLATLNPGEGAMINLPVAASFTFTGTPVTPVLPVTLPCGCNATNLLSRQITNAPSTFQAVTGFLPTQGTSLTRVHGGVTTVYTYSGGVWAPGTPTLNLGESALIYVPCACCPDTGGVKYVQYPDVNNGIDVNATFTPPDPFSFLPWVLADDFPCTNSGPITDIHLWGSWLNNQVDPNAVYTLAIWSDAPTNSANPNYSHPDQLLWTQTYSSGQYALCPYTNKYENFYNGDSGLYGYPNLLGNSTNLYYLCFDASPTNTFSQTGTPTAQTNYWLSVTVQSNAGNDYFGWKSSATAYNDTAVAAFNGNFYPLPSDWYPMTDAQGLPLSMAFKITTTTNTCVPPTVSGPTSVTNCVGTPASFAVIASGTGPFTYQWSKNAVPIPGATGSIYSLPVSGAGDAGTYCVMVNNSCGTMTTCATLTVIICQTNTPGQKWLQVPDTTPNGIDVRVTDQTMLADDFPCTASGPISEVRIWGSWLNDVMSPNACFCLGLWTDVPNNATGTYSQPGQMLCETCFYPGQYTNFLYTNVYYEQFWDPFNPVPGQQDSQVWEYVFTMPTNSCWFQTVSNTYWLSLRIPQGCFDTYQYQFGWKTCPTNWNDDAVYGYVPGYGWTDLHRPPDYTNSLDLAFQIITPSNSIPVISNAPGQKWLQIPDATPNGIDVRVTDQTMLADDFRCDYTGPITEVRIWGSWLNDVMNTTPCFCLGLWTDVPTNSANPFSQPGQMLCETCFYPGQYTNFLYANVYWEQFWDPFTGASGQQDSQVWEYVFTMPANSCWWQTNGNTYWLSLRIPPGCFDTYQYQFGWKTCPTNWNDDAVYGYYPGYGWQDLHRPPYYSNSLDLAFQILTSTNPPPVNTNCCDNCTSPITNTVVVTPGYNFLVNPLCHGTNNTVGVLLPNVPDGTVLRKWDAATQNYDPVITYDSGFGGWVDSAFNDASGVTLEPGVGFELENPDGQFTITWIGCIPNCPLPCLPPPSGSVLVGGVGPGVATWTNLSSCPPVCGTRVLIWNGASFDEYDYFGNWTPGVPVVAPGHSVFVSFVASTNCCTNNLVCNGSFESPALTPDQVNYPTSLNCWTTTDSQGVFEVWTAGLSVSIPAEDGNQSIELNARDLDETISQTVTGLSTNCVAKFCFWYTGRNGSVNGTPDNDFTVTITAGNGPDVFSVPLDPISYYATNGGWAEFCTNFVPPTSILTLKFRGKPHSGSQPSGAHIDNVSLTQCCTNMCITLNCSSDKTVPCGSGWSFDPPTNIVDTCCNNYTLTFTTVTNSGSCQPGFTRTWVVSDVCGNTNTCTQTVTVLPSVPQLLCSNITIACGSPIPTNPPAWTDPCCSNVTISLIGSTTTTNGCNQTISQTWQALDQCCGTSNFCSRAVTIVNTNPPVITCVSNKTVSCTSAWSFDLPSAYDSCTGSNLMLSILSTVTSNAAPCMQVSTRTWGVTNACGYGNATALILSVDFNTNSSPTESGPPVFSSFNIAGTPAAQTVSFPTDPLLTSGNTKISLSSSAGNLDSRDRGTPLDSGSFTFGDLYRDFATTFDNDRMLQIQISGLNPYMRYRITFYAFDAGTPVLSDTFVNTTTVPQPSTSGVINQTSPSISSNDQFALTMDAIADGSGIVTFSETSAASTSPRLNGLQIGVTGFTCSQTVTVTNPPPVITCSSNKTVTCGTAWTFDAPSAYAACCTNVTVQLISSNQIAGPCPAVWQGIWQAEDCCANTATCTQTVTVVSCVPLPSGSVLWLPFDESSGTNTANLYPGGNNGTLIGGPAHNLGAYVDNSLCFSAAGGVDQYVSVADYAAIDPLGKQSFTLDAWVSRAVGGPNSPSCVILDKRDTVSGNGYSMSVDYGHVILTLSGSNYADLTDVIPADGSWHLVAVTVTPGVAGNFYVDNHPPVPFTPALANLVTTAPFLVGESILDNHTLDQPWQGCIDEVEMFNRVLSASEVNTIFLAGPGGKCKTPELVCATNKTVECGSTWSFDPPVVANPCGGTNINPVILSTVTTGLCPQVSTRTWLYVDACGYSNTCSQTVMVVDTTPPVITCLSNKTVECGLSWTFDQPSAYDLCCGTNVLVSAYLAYTSGNACSNLNTMVWKATDCCGNVSYCTQTVAVVDTTPPALTCASNKTVSCGAAWTFDAPAVYDSCSGTNVTLTFTTSSNGVCPQLITRAWTATDPCGNRATCTQAVTVVDITPPVITCAANKTVLCGTAWTFDAPSAYDACCTNVTLQLISSNQIAGPCPTVWQGVWQAKDCCANSATCTQTVTVASCVPVPSGLVLWLPFDESSGTNTANLYVGGNNGTLIGGPAHNLGAYVDNSLCFSAAGGVDQYVSVSNYPAIDPLAKQSFTLDAWVSRAVGGPNSPSCVILDKRDPVGGDGYSMSVDYGHVILTLSGSNYADLTDVIPADGSWHFVAVTVTPGVAGNFYVDGHAPVPFTPALVNLVTTAPFLVGESILDNHSLDQPWQGCIDEVEMFNRVLSASEINTIFLAGPGGKCKTPELVCATNKTVECGTTWSFDPPVVSNPCGGTNLNPVILSTVTNGTYHINFIGGGSVADAVINVVGGVAVSGYLQITAGPQMGTYNLSPGAGSDGYFYWDNQVFPGSNPFLDVGGLLFSAGGVEFNLWSTGPGSYTLAGAPPAYSPYVTGVATLGLCPEVITRTWLYVDGCGNSNTCSQTVTVADTTPPVITCVSNKTVECGTTWNFDPPSVFDACSGTNVTLTFTTSSNGACPQVITRTWTATDLCGNTNHCSQVVTVVDTTPPVILCTDFGVPCGTAWLFGTPFVSDNCCGTNVVLTVLSTTTNGTCPQFISRAWKATDCCGNSATCTQNVAIVDITPPVITCASNKTVLCGTAWTFDAPGAYDACCTNVTVQLISSNQIAGPCPTVWQGVWRATDCCTNSATCTQTVTVVSCVPAPSSLVLWLPFDESSGTNTANLYVGGNNGTLIGGPAHNLGAYVDNSLCFSAAAGVDQYVSVPDYAAIDPLAKQSFTLDAWVSRAVGGPNSPSCVILDKRDPVSGDGYSLSVDYGHVILTLSGNNYADVTDVIPADGSWHFVAVTVTPGVAGNFYVDGHAPVPFAPALVNLVTTAPFLVGESILDNHGGNQPWQGCIDEVEMFNRTLSASEINAIFLAGPGGKCKSPTLVCATNKTVECGATWSFDPPVVANPCGGTNLTPVILSTVTNGTYHIIFIGGGTAANATINVVGGIAVSGYLQITAGPQMGTYNLSPGAGSDGYFYWDNQVFPGSNPFLDIGGLLFSGGGVEFNLWSTGPGSYTLAGAPPAYSPYVTGVASLGLCPEVITRTWLYVDGCGNSNTCSQTVTIADTTPPTIICGSNKTVECGTTWNFDTPSAFDSCSGTNVTLTFTTSTNGVCPQVITRTWTATDLCGNTNICSQVVTVVDTTPPVILCTDFGVPCGTAWSFGTPFVSDNCCGTNVVVTVLSTTTNGTCPQFISRVWKATDCCGNSATCTQNVAIVDITPPVITCASNKTVLCGTAWTFDAPGAYDACCTNVTVQLISSNQIAGPCPTVWQGVWRATDCCTNSATCTQTVTVVSCVPPPSSLVLWLPFDESSGTNTANLYVGGNSGMLINGPTHNLGTYVDNSLCFDGVSSYVEVADYSALNIGTNDFSVDAWVKPATFDNTVRIIVDHRAETGTNVVGYSFFLGGGNTLAFQIADGTFINYPSTLAVPADDLWHHVAVTVKRNNTQGIHFYLDGVVGSPGRDPTGHPASLTPPPGYPFRVGSRSSSVSGIFLGCIDEVEVFTRELAGTEVQGLFNAGPAGKCKSPTLVCATNKTVECGATWSFDPPAVANPCGGTNSPVILSTVTNGTYHIVFNGGGTAANATINVVGGVAVSGYLQITAGPQMGTYNLSPGSGSDIYFIWDNLVFPGSNPFLDIDGLFFSGGGLEFNLWSTGPGSYTLAGAPPAYLPNVTGVATLGLCPEVITRTWLYVDGCGNSNTCSQTVTVVDTTPPAITCVPNKTVECGTTWNFDAPSAFDGCSGTNVLLTFTTSSNGVCPQVITRTWTATDICGNTNSCSQVVTVRDTTPPTIACVADKSVPCGTNWTFDLPSAYDACCTNVIVQLISSNQISGPCPAVWQGIWRAMDCCNNSAACTQTVTVACCNTNPCPPQPLVLFNTGVGTNGAVLAVGAVDLHYTLTVNPSGGGSQAYVVNAYPGWLANSATSAWIGPTNYTSAVGNTTYVYRVTFDLPCTNNAMITGQWAADNSGYILANGNPTPVATLPCCPSANFTGLNPFTITASQLVPGLNTLDFYVFNQTGPTGLRVELSGTATCCCVTPPTNMVAWWPLDETSGTLALDVVGGHDGTATPGAIGTATGPAPVPGEVSGALFFNASDYVNVPSAPALNFAAGNLSIDAWVNVPSQGGLIYTHPIVHKFDWNQNKGYYLALVSSYPTGAQLRFVMGGGGAPAQYLSGSSPAVVPYGAWTHVAVTVDRAAATVTFFINGSPVSLTSPPIPASIANTQPLWIGTSSEPGVALRQVAVDELELFNRALAPQEIQAILNAGVYGKCKCVPGIRPTLRYTQVGNTIILTWPGCCILQEANTVLGPWTDLSTATSPYTVTTSSAHKFYRLRCP